MAREYGWSFERYLEAEPTQVNAFYAAACEHAGLIGTYTFAHREIDENPIKAMSGELGY